MADTSLYLQAQACACEVADMAGLKPGSVLVIGCSTSAVTGKKIGSAGSTDIASVLFDAFAAVATSRELNLVFQCCEHLNRALVMERKLANQLGCELVSVVPKPDAGGALASYAYNRMNEPVVVEFVKADAGMDVGGVLVGMHIRHVAVPLKLNHCVIGSAAVVAAKSRSKLIGGRRARYE